MKRKIIEMSGKTLLVSIPKPIAKKFDLEKGEEIEVSCTDKQIILYKDSRMSKRIFLPFLQEPSLFTALKIAYAEGYDEVVCTIDPACWERIQPFLLQELPGFECISLNKTMAVVRAVLDISYDDLRKVIRKITLLLTHALLSGTNLKREAESMRRLCLIAQRMVAKKMLSHHYVPILGVFEYFSSVLPALHKKGSGETHAHIRFCISLFFSFDINLFCETYVQNETFLDNVPCADLKGVFERLREYLEVLFRLHLRETAVQETIGGV